MQWRGNLPLLYDFADAEKFFLATFWRQKVAQKPRGDKFSGASLAVGKTDAVALLLREKVSVFNPPPALRPFSEKFAGRV